MILITGGCGFIGSHIVDKLIDQNFEVYVIDNLSSGKIEFIKHHFNNSKFKFIQLDLKDFNKCLEILKDIKPEIIIHMAANPEVRISVTDPEIHFRENIVVTFNLLEACRKVDCVKKFAFASSSTVYGDAKVFPTPENYELKPISVYGACKIACEALICSYSYLYGFQGIVLRYANIIGPRLRHGVIYDFIMKLKNNPTELEILGDGTQKKRLPVY